jgi:hypothetical protein
MLRNRNCGIISPKRAISPKLNLEDTTESTVQVTEATSSLPASPQSPFKSAEDKIAECLYGAEVVDTDKLKKLSWNGLPSQYRPICWKILMVTLTFKNTYN